MRPHGTPELVERDTELARLGELVTAAALGHGRCAAVVGPAGIGKSRVLHAARDIARQAGLRCLPARGGELEADYPYGVVRQLFEQPLRTMDSAEQATLLTGAARLAAPVLDLAPGKRSADPFAMVHGLYWLSVNLVSATPLMLLVDDLHWADEASLRFLAYLARRVADLPVLLLTGTRPTATSRRAELLDALLTEPGTVELPLAPLSDDGIAWLVEARYGTPPDPEFSRACAAATAGNPFLCVTLVDALADAGVPPETSAAPSIADFAVDAVSTTILRRLGTLPTPAVRLARALSVLGTESELTEVAQLAGLSPREAADAADVLIGHDILRDELPMEFVHPLVRAAIRDRIPAPERALSHAEAARLTAADERPVERIALHLLAAPPAAQEWVVDTLRQAATRAMGHGEPSAAVAALRRALREPPGQVGRVAVLHELGVAEFRAGEVDAAVRTLSDARRLADGPRLRAEIGRDLGLALFQSRRFAEAVAVQDDARRDALDVDVDLTAWLTAERHQAAMMDAAAYRSLGDLLDVGAAVAGETGGERALLGAMGAERSLRTAGSSDDAVALARRAFDKGLLTDLSLSSSGIGVIALFPFIYADHLGDARPLAAAMVDDARHLGSPVAAVRAYLVSALVRRYEGALRDAESDARSACELGLDAGLLPARMAAGLLIEVLVERGELAEADDVLRQARFDGDIALEITENWGLFGRGRLRLAQGCIDDAIADLTELGRRGEECWRPWNPAILPYRSWLALALLRNGDQPEALRLASEELRFARRWGAPRAIGTALGTVGLATGDLARLRKSAAVLAESPAQLEYARSLVELGAALRRNGSRSEARTSLRQGMELASRCGASALAEHAHTELRATGARPRRLVRTGVDALTPSELRVARIAADGLSNPAIAQALFVTLRTVEVHLTHTYEKLGISSRQQLPDALKEA